MQNVKSSILALVVLALLGLLGLPASAAHAGRPLARPTLTGAPYVGSTLTATPPAGWTHRTMRWTWQWSFNGHRIHRATHAVFAITPRYAGTRLSVTVTGHRRGRPAVSRTSAPILALGSSPLVGGRWGVYQGTWDGLWPAYSAASGATKALLAKEALQPRAIWFTDGQPTSKVRQYTADYIAAQQAGDPSTLVQMAVFREWPTGEGGRGTPLTAAQQTDYQNWINQMAAGIGTARVAIILEPDLGLDAPLSPHEDPHAGSLHTADPAVRLALVKYAAATLAALPNTTVYLDGSSADWLSIPQAVQTLTAAGISSVRGFALGATHYSTTANEITYGAALVQALAAAGAPGKHFVIDTADNGRGFTYPGYYAKHPGGFFDNAEPCSSPAETQCDTLGIPPTTQVTGQPGLGLSAEQEAEAAQDVDAYLWFGRPWLTNQAWPFDQGRALQVAATTPWQ